MRKGAKERERERDRHTECGRERVGNPRYVFPVLLSRFKF